MDTVLVDPFEGPVKLGMLPTAYEGGIVICPTPTVEESTGWEVYAIGRRISLFAPSD
jgi:hypothetical protein